MIELNIPGIGVVQLEHLVCDVNGTLAADGKLIDGVIRAVDTLRDRLTIHLLTADTFGRQEVIDHQLNLKAFRLELGNEAEQKAEYVRQLGAEKVIAIGQGANDALMLRAAKIGVCVISPEGLAVETMTAAKVITPDITAAFDLILKPLRLVATLRK